MEGAYAESHRSSTVSFRDIAADVVEVMGTAADVHWVPNVGILLSENVKDSRQ